MQIEYTINDIDSCDISPFLIGLSLKFGHITSGRNTDVYNKFNDG